VGPKSDDDVVICAYARTAMTKARRGAQKDTSPEIMLSVVMKDVMRKANVDPKLIQEMVIGNVNQPGGGATTARMAGFLAGIPETATLMAINRFCSSGLQACASLANSIRSGQIDIGIAGGVENMSMFDM